MSRVTIIRRAFVITATIRDPLTGATWCEEFYATGKATMGGAAKEFRRWLWRMGWCGRVTSIEEVTYEEAMQQRNIGA